MALRLGLLICLATAACAPTAAETARAERSAAKQQIELSKALTGLTPGEPVSCLGGIDRRNAQARTIGGTALFVVNRHRIFRNDMQNNCPELARDPILVTQTPTSQLCRGDIVQLIDRASRISRGACAYGDFIPYEGGS